MRKIKKSEKSKIHAIALYDDTWDRFKELRDRYNLSADGLFQVLMDNFDPLDLNDNIRAELRLLKKNSKFTAQKQRIIEAANNRKKRNQERGNKDNFFKESNTKVNS